MREGLQEAAKRAGASELDGYPKGSTVICQHCFLPLYRLERGLYPGQKTKDTGNDYRPLTVADIDELRRDVPSVHAAMKTWTPDQVREHCERIPRFTNGMAPVCVACGHSFPQIFAPTASEFGDRAYTWVLVTIPPLLKGPLPIRTSEVSL